MLTLTGGHVSAFLLLSRGLTDGTGDGVWRVLGSLWAPASPTVKGEACFPCGLDDPGLAAAECASLMAAFVRAAANVSLLVE